MPFIKRVEIFEMSWGEPMSVENLTWDVFCHDSYVMHLVSIYDYGVDDMKCDLVVFYLGSLSITSICPS